MTRCHQITVKTAGVVAASPDVFINKALKLNPLYPLETVSVQVVSGPAKPGHDIRGGTGGEQGSGTDGTPDAGRYSSSSDGRDWRRSLVHDVSIVPPGRRIARPPGRERRSHIRSFRRHQWIVEHHGFRESFRLFSQERLDHDPAAKIAPRLAAVHAYLPRHGRHGIAGSRRHQQPTS